MAVDTMAQDLNRVHRRYIRVSNHFKSAWTFHQFLQGLQKVFTDGNVRSYPADFQPVYNDLKAAAQNLTETTTDQVSKMLDSIEHRLTPICQGLLQADDEIAPSLLRQFFQRVKNYDENILGQLVKFYLFSQTSRNWNLQRLDKVDFLATKFAEEYHESRDAFVLRDHAALREALASFRASLESEPVGEAEIETIASSLQAIKRDATTVQSIDDLHQSQLVQRYRDLKHGLGHRFFEPKVLMAILEVNLQVKNQIHQLYRRDEQRIIAEYQQVFELERDVPVDVVLSSELAEFKLAVERFENQLQGENLKLQDLVELRRKVRDLLPKLKPASEPETQPTPLVKPRELREEVPETAAAMRSSTLVAESGELDAYVEEYYQRIVRALDDTNPTLDPKRVVLQPEIFGLNLGPREVVAYRRLYGGGTCDRGLETFILQSAGLRARIEHEVDEIKGILDDSSITREAPVYKVARVTCQKGDWLLRRFEHYIEVYLLEGDAKEARELQVLRMRLMRGYSGLWLMVHR
jgi:hypothetical protein